MREILFRQRIKSNKTNINGDFHYWGYMDDGFIGPMGKNEAVGDSEQYTGLRDKNGVKIFEGDILYIAGMGNCLVGFEDGFFGFTVESKTNIESIGHSLEDIETVIGSIHENPELINQ